MSAGKILTSGGFNKLPPISQSTKDNKAVLYYLEQPSSEKIDKARKAILEEIKKGWEYQGDLQKFETDISKKPYLLKAEKTLRLIEGKKSERSEKEKVSHEIKVDTTISYLFQSIVNVGGNFNVSGSNTNITFVITQPPSAKISNLEHILSPFLGQTNQYKCYRVERTALLQKIEDNLRKKSIVVIHGISGVGKTWLAQAISDRQKQVYWIDGRTQDTIISAYISIAKALGYTKEEKISDFHLVVRVKDYFNKLDIPVVLDDVPNVETLYWQVDGSHEKLSLIPEEASKQLSAPFIITSQSGNFSELNPALVPVDKLSTDEAIELFQKVIGNLELFKKIQPDAPLDVSLVKKFVEDLFCHPLLLNLTACFIREESRDNRFRSTNHILQREWENLQKSKDSLPHDSKGKITPFINRRWESNLRRAKEKEPAIEQCLKICGYLSPVGIPVEWLMDKGFEGSINGMIEYGFCHIHSDGKKIDMHPFIQILSRKMDENRSYLISTAQMLCDLFDKISKLKEEENKNYLTLIQLHLETLSSYLDESKENEKQCLSNVLNCMPNHFYLPVPVNVKSLWTLYLERTSLSISKTDQGKINK